MGDMEIKLERNLIKYKNKEIKIEKIIEDYINNKEKKYKFNIEKVLYKYFGEEIKNLKLFKNLNLKILKNKNFKYLSQGKNGKIYLYKNLYIIKKINTQKNIESKIMEYLKKEIIFPKLSPNIIQIYDCQIISNKNYLIMEKGCMDLSKYILTNKYPKKIVTKILKNIILQVLFTLNILNDKIKNFTHNDLKIDNILLIIKEREKDIYLKYENNYWIIPKNYPLVKITDFDFSNIPSIINNPKINNKLCLSFGCKAKQLLFYDYHLFLNSLFCYKKYLPSAINKWIKLILPSCLIGLDSEYLKYGRIKNPEEFKNDFESIPEIIKNSYFKEFKIKEIKRIKKYNIWGI